MTSAVPKPIWQDALSLCRDLQSGRTQAMDVMANVYDRIEQINPTINAIVNLLPRAQAMSLARAADGVPLENRGPLHGLPMAPKDAVAVSGFPTNWGFRPFSQPVESKDDPMVSRLRTAGAIFIGHSNMPEFGLGSHTFNALFGHTLNPYDLTKTPGGSSGGAAAALAARLLPLADGSDLGGSLRNPASFCNVVGLRPSIGRMPLNRGFGWYGRLATTGPMATNLRDLALLFSVMAGPDEADPMSLDEPGHAFLDALTPYPTSAPLRVRVSRDLNGLPVESSVTAIVEAAASTFTDLGADVSYGEPDLTGAMQIFQVQRAAGLRILGQTLDQRLPQWRDEAKDTAIWNIEKGLALTVDEVLQAELNRTALYARAAAFFQDVDVLILPAAQVQPFDKNVDWVRSINGKPMATYLDWMSICCMISVTGFPALSIPGGFTENGLPVGIQMVSAPRQDLHLMRIAHLFEQRTAYALQRPDLA